MHSSTSENPSGNLAHIFPNEFRLSRKKYVSYFKRFVYEVSPVELRMERCENAKEGANEGIQWKEKTRSPRVVKFRRVLFFKASQISARFSLSPFYDASRILLENELIPLTSSREIIDNATNVGEFHESSSCF